MTHITGNIEVAAYPPEGDRRNRPSWLAVTTGLNLAIALSYLTCKPPETHTLSLRARLFASASYILITCLAGTLGTWIALPCDRRRHFRSLVLWGVRGWVFLPAIMMFLREGSVWAPVVAVLSAALMAAHLSHLTGEMTSPEVTKPHQEVEKDLFITQLRFEPISWLSLGASLCLYGSFLSAIDGKLTVLTLLLGASAFLLVSQITAAQSTEHKEKENLDRTTHPYSLIAVAFLCAFVALSASSGTSDLVWKLRAFHVLEHALATSRPTKSPSEERSSWGYQAIVLWPIQKKEKVIPSPPSGISPSSRSIARPWAIPFYGPYWYFKIPGDSPGPKARIARGDPLKVNIRSTDRAPLLMEAHQNLADPIDLACCREIQVVFKNDTSLGASEVGLSLTDSHAKGKPSQNLGIKLIPLNHPAQPPGDTSAVEETVSFPFPKSGKIKKFDQITVVLLPDAKHLTAGRKVAIEKFLMIPN